MQKIIFLLLLVLVVSVSQAQNRGAVAGTVTDGEDASLLEYATVAVVEPRDSSLISYTLTTKEGTFTLRNLPAEQPLKVIVSFVGYQNFRKIIQLQKGETLDFGSIKLSKNVQLAEVTVTGERQPVVFKKDTIEFNVEAFKTRPNAVVEDLLKKLPGLQVDIDGTITVNGRKVSKITVDGKDFFASDITVASKNIDVSLVDKVQVIDDRENDPDRLKNDAEVDKIINLKLKRAIKKSVFGKVYAGQGTRDRFEAGGMLNMFRDTLQLSVIGFGNNVNRAAFSNSDLHSLGGFGRSGTSTYEAGVDVGGRSWGIQNIGSGGFNLNYDLPKKLKTNLMYFYNNSVNNSESDGYSILPVKTDTTLFTDRSSRYTNFQTRHNINGLLQWTVDTASNIRYQPKVSFNEYRSISRENSLTENNYGNTVATQLNDGRRNGNSMGYEHRLAYYRRFKKKDQSINITNNLRLNPSNSTNLILAHAVQYKHRNGNILTNNIPSNQELLVEEATNSGNFDIYYRHPLSKKVVSDWTLSTLYEGNIQERATYKYNPETQLTEEFLPDQSSDVQRDQLTYRIRPGLTWNISNKKRLQASAVLQKQNVFNTFKSIDQEINRSYYHVLPSLSYSAGQLSINYNMNLRQPYISQLQPAVMVWGLYRSSGNPDLRPVKSHSVYMSYRKNIPASQIDYNISTNASLDENSIIQATIVDASEGTTFNKPINSGVYSYTWSHMQVSKRFKKVHDIQARISLSLNMNTNMRPIYMNKQEDTQHQYSPGLSSYFSLSWKELVQLEPNYSYSRNFNRYAVNTENNINSFSHRLNNMIRVSWPKKVIWELNQQYTYNSLIQRGFQKSTNLLHGSVSLQMLPKDKGQLKLTCFDLLNENRGIYSYVYDREQSTGTQLVLRRYFMLTFQYNFNKTVTK
ncbi:outer membrane beta-barrel protein [Botryobacter ruber]|uniref:outer membrane beta-barrel protein n=1 Tax=Botryobacter ruber TaxID=2171629 RepID=UPI000E0B4646|nr:outer membrane beta-barrel protein [Botryobacter ruber]